MTQPWTLKETQRWWLKTILTLVIRVMNLARVWKLKNSRAPGSRWKRIFHLKLLQNLVLPWSFSKNKIWMRRCSSAIQLIFAFRRGELCSLQMQIRRRIHFFLVKVEQTKWVLKHSKKWRQCQKSSAKKCANIFALSLLEKPNSMSASIYPVGCPVYGRFMKKMDDVSKLNQLSRSSQTVWELWGFYYP